MDIQKFLRQMIATNLHQLGLFTEGDELVVESPLRVFGVEQAKRIRQSMVGLPDRKRLPGEMNQGEGCEFNFRYFRLRGILAK